MNLIYLLDPASPEWLQGILGIVVRILGVEFAGYAMNATDGDQFTVVETTGMPKDNSLQGSSFLWRRISGAGGALQANGVLEEC